ncbi:unnamed protein product [Mytilus coruscus]|uniref:Reverse transcriptase domain-containing protein n=1 Tax=Mytilus coruscus TaxID=42192 RepID=A0A6J8APV4_MYTCO|nr:unnamed protein product [Mytilus coruscus]
MKDKDWKILDDWYIELTSKVSGDGYFSKLFEEEQGVRQGVTLSPLLYKLLNSFEDEHIGANICSIHEESPTCADDVSLLSKRLFELQTMLLMQEHYYERYILSDAKSKSMTFNNNKYNVLDRVNLNLHGSQLEKVESYTYIGIQRNCVKSNLIVERITMTRRTSYALMGTGPHGYNEQIYHVMEGICEKIPVKGL